MDNKTLQTLQEIDSIDIARSIEYSGTSDLTKHIYINKNDLTIISQNIRSIYHNFDDFLITYSSLTFDTDIIILTECRLNVNKPIPQLNNYCSYATKYQVNQNGGVVVYVKNTLQPKVKEIQISQASCLQLDLLNNTILCIYRSPSNTNTDSFIDSLDTHLSTLNTQNNVIIAGDININIKTKSVELPNEFKNRANYLNMLSTHGILPGHCLPTREKNCLDHFMLKINKKKVSAFIAIIQTSTTDHFTTFLSLSKLKSNIRINKTKNSIDFEKALKHLRDQNLQELLFCEDPNLLISQLIQRITDSLKTSTEIRVIPSNKRVIKPWITTGILRCIKNRNNLQKQARKDPHDEILKITYKRYRNYCNNLLKHLKRKYERELLAKSVSNNKLLWKNIKNITYCNKSKDQNTELLNIKSSPLQSINYINEYFVNIGKKLAQLLNSSGHNIQHHNLPTQSNSFVLLNTDTGEVESILMNLKTDSAPGWDGISTRFLKYAKNELIPIFTHLTNLCFEKGVFPEKLKKSSIVPIFKGGDRGNISNYRPISILPAISKILEKLINIRLLNYLNSFNILSPYQFGFRHGKSSEDAVARMTSLVVDDLDKGQKCLTVYLDLMKAFDTVSVPLLLYKLEKVGVRGTALKLFRDYFSNRNQCVKVDQFISDDATISYGVPQGSILGPSLFLLYINDLCNLKIENAQIISYADDTAVIFKGKSWQEVKERAEFGMAQVAKWLNLNLLTLNAAKTNYICFSISKRTQPSEDFNIRIHTCNNIKNCAFNNNCPFINKVTYTQYLGVIIDQKLSWYSHIEHVSNRIAKLNWIFRTLRHVVPRKASTELMQNKLLNDIYTALVQSVLGYCISIWGGACKTKFIHLERAQRGLIKNMYFKNRRYPTTSLYKETQLLSVRKIYVLHTILKKHKSLSFNPNILQKRRKELVAQVPNTHTFFARVQYSKRAAELYNKINKHVGIYTMTHYECKNAVKKYLQPLDYEEIESLLEKSLI